MKKVFYGFLVLLLMAGVFAIDAFDILSTKVNAEIVQNTDENLLTVNGSGTVKAKPDICYINIGVDTFAEDAGKAQSDNSKIMDKITKELSRLGIKEEDVKTITYNIYKSVKYEPVFGQDNAKKIQGYNAINIVEVTVRDIKKVGIVIDAAAKAGANTINNIRFDVTDEKDLYNEALKIAMNNAKEKAQAILGTFGANVGKPYSIDENNYSSPIIYRESMLKFSSDIAEGYSTPVEAGELEITARVMVKYKY